MFQFCQIPFRKSFIYRKGNHLSEAQELKAIPERTWTCSLAPSSLVFCYKSDIIIEEQ